MPRRSLEDRNTRKLIRNSGGSIIVTLPIEHIRELGWRDNQKVTINLQGKKLVIEDWKE